MSEQKLLTINGVKYLELKKTVEEIKKDPALAQCEFRAENEWVIGDENCTFIRDYSCGGQNLEHKQTFELNAAEPPQLQGSDNGANPVEFLLGALAGCITTTIVYHASLHNHKIEKVNSSYKGTLDLQGILNLDPKVRPGYQKIEINFRVKTKAPQEEIASYYKFSPVYDMLSKSVPVEITVETYE